MSKEWSRSGSFMKKPSTGWLHDDAALSQGDGIYYPVKYVGSIPIEMSMRDMGFEDRTAVTREAITLVCEMAGLREPHRRKVSRLVKQSLVADPVLKNLNVKLTISTTGVALVVIETNQVIANHIMPCISFATGGDPTDYDVIGYVAKDARNKRECHVFDCGHMAHDCIATMGQAFELRFKAFLAKNGGGPGASAGSALRARPAPGTEQLYDEAGGGREQLYDDLPGGEYGGGGGGGYGGASGGYGEVNYGGQQTYDSVDGGAYGGGDATYDNGPSTYNYGAGGGGSAVYDNKDGALGGGRAAPRFDDAVYDNAGGAAGGSGYGELPAASAEYTYGEHGEYDDVLESPAGYLDTAPGGSDLDRDLRSEIWYHGPLPRDAADRLLHANGEFLVRESIQSPGQYVLSAMQDGEPKHLLLVDPQGQVRTRDMSFDSVSHLINYHLRAKIPIVSRGSRIQLGEPVHK